MVHRGGLETVSEKNKKDDFNICIAENAKTADGEIYDDNNIEQLTPKTKQQTKRAVKKALSKSTSLPLSDHSISQSVVRVERSRFIKKKTTKLNSKADSSAKSTCISPVRAGLRSNSLESHTSTTSNNNNAKGKKKKANTSKKAAAAAAANAKPAQPIDSPLQETVNPISDDSKSSQSKLSPQLPLTFICSVPLDRLTGILEHLKIDRTLTKCIPGVEEDTSLDDKQNVDQNSSQCKTLCLYCDKRMSTVKVRARHIERFHTISKERRSSTRNPVAPSQDSKDSGCSLSAACSSSPSTPKSSTSLVFSGCSFCSKSPKLQAVALETDLNALFFHLVDLHSDKYFGCKLCAIRFQNAAKLDDHMQRTHIQLNSKTTHPSGDANSPDEDRSVSEFGKSTPTKTRRQMKQVNAESGRTNSDVFLPPAKAGSSTSSSVSRNGSMFSNDEPILSRLGVTQNRLPRGRKGIRSRRPTNVDSVKPETNLISVKTRSKVGRVCTSNEPVETVFRTPTNTRTEPLSCTFDDDFYEKVFVNVRNNLGCHLDGKLGKDSGSNRRPQSPPPLIPAIRSTVVKSPQVVESEVHTATSLAALTAFPTLLTAEQYGCDFGSAKIKRPITKHSWKWKWDSVKKYKYVNEGGKIVKKIKQPMLGLRDLSKLDMWTQLTMRQKHEVARRQAEATTSSSCFLEQECSREEKQKQIDQLNTILDSRRLPQIILEQNEQTIIKLEITDEGLRYLAGEMSTQYDGPSSSLAADRVIPANLNLIPSRSLGESLRHTVVLSGEWARPRCYVCFGCGARFDKLKALEEHKMFRHPHVYSTHYEIVGRELIEGNLYKHFFIPLKALSRHREYAQGMLVNKKTEDSVSKSSSNSAIEDESLDSLHSVTISFTTVSSSKLSDDCDTDTKTAIENVSSSYTEPSTLSTKNDSSPTVVSSSSVNCTKCNRNCHGILELYRHMLDCSGDYAWLLAKKKKYRYYGSRKRRQFNKHNISALNLHKRKLKRNKDEHESDATPKKKIANMSPSTPRPRPSDADSIRKMLENLPPKRVCREIIPNATKPRARKFKTTVGRKLQQNSVNKKCKSSNATLTAISKKLLRNHKLRAISEKDKISRSNKILENKRKSARVNSSAILVSKTAQSENRADKKTEPGKGGIVRKIGAQTKRFVKKIKKHLLGNKKQTEGNNDTVVNDVEKTAEKKASKVSAVRKLTFDKEQDVGNKKEEGECEDKPKDIESQQTLPSVEVNQSANKPEIPPSDECKEPTPAIPIDTESEWKKSQDTVVSENPSSMRSEGSMENLHQHQGELSASTEDLRRGAAGFLQNQVSPTTKRRSKKINDCIAMLTGKLQEKLGKPFLECKATVANDGTAQSQGIAEISNVLPSNESKDTKLPKRKAFTRRIVKCDPPPVEQSATLTLPPPAIECTVKLTEPQVIEPQLTEPQETPKESPIHPVTKPTSFLEPPVNKKPIIDQASAKQNPMGNCQPKMELQLSKTPALNELIPVPVKKAPPPIVTVEITTLPPVMLKELPKKSLATERKQPPKQQCVINADTIRVPCIKPPQLTIPQFTPAQIPLPRGMISRRRQTIAGAPNDFLSEMNSIRSANNYNNLPFELEVPLDLSKKPKRSSPKSKANPKAFPPHHHPQISVKPNAVLMPSMPFHLPILPQTQIIPILCEPLQQKVPQIPLQGPPVVFAKEVAAKSPIVSRKRSNRKQESSANIDVTPPMINLIIDTPSPKKVHKTPTAAAEEKLNSILVSEPPAAPAKKKQNLIKESILSLPVVDGIGLAKVNEALISTACELECKEKPNRVEKPDKVVQPIAKLPTEVECVPVPIHNLMEEAKVSPAPMLIATPVLQIIKPATTPAIVIEEIGTTQVIELGKSETTPKVEIHKAVAAPVVEIHEPVTAPVIEIQKPVTTPVVEIHEPLTAPVVEMMEVVTTVVMKIDTLTSAKEITKKIELNEIKDSKETTALATTNKKPNQAILKKGSSISASSTPMQTNKQSDVLEKVDQKCELSPESQRSLPTRRSRRNKAADEAAKNSHKPVVNDVRPAALKEVEAIAASFLSEDEQENEDVLPVKMLPKTVEVKTTETSEVRILAENDHEDQNVESLNVQTPNPDEKDKEENNVKATETPTAEKTKLDKDINNIEPTQLSNVERPNPIEKSKKKNESQPTEWPKPEKTKLDETDKKKNEVKPTKSPKAEKAKLDKIDKQMSETKATESLNVEKVDLEEIDEKNNEIKPTEMPKTEKAKLDDVSKKKNAIKNMESTQGEKAKLDEKDKEKKQVEVSIVCETNKKLSSSTEKSAIPSTKNESKYEVTAPISQDISKKPRRRRKNELAAIVADQLMESFKEVDKSRIDDLKKLENLAYEKSEDLLLTGMRLMPTTKRKNVLDHKKEISGENDSKVAPTKEAKKQKSELAKEKKMAKDDTDRDTQKVDVKLRNQKEDVEITKVPNSKADGKPNSLPLDFGSYRTNSVDSWSHRGPAALLSPENEKSPNNDLIGMHKKSKKKQMKKRDKKIEIENINQLRTGLESFTFSKDVVVDIKEDTPLLNHSAEQQLSIVGLFTPTQRNTSTADSAKEPEVSAFASLANVKTTSSILRPSILAASLDIATNKENPAQSDRKSCISSRDPRLNKNIHTDEGDQVAIAPETSTRLSTLRQRRKSLADVTAPTQAIRTNSRSTNKRSDANSRRASLAFDDDDDDNYLTAIAKRVNDKIMSAEDKDFNLANDGFELASSFLDMDDPYGRPSTSMSVRSAPNFNEDRSNMDTMDATNTDLIDMDVDDDMSVYTTFSQDTTRSVKGRRRRRRRSVLLTRKPKKTNINTMEPTEMFDCLLCNKTFAKATALNKHQLTIAHVTKVSEQEYLNATRKQAVVEQAAPVLVATAKKPIAKIPPAVVAESPKQNFSAIQSIRLEECIIPPKPQEIHEKQMERVAEKPTQPKVPYIPPNSILNQSGIEPISSPEQNYERYSTKTSSRLTLNPDERLFYECCNILKGSETPLIERTYPIVPPTTYAYDLQVKPVTPKSTNERYSYIKQSTAEACGKREAGAYPRLDVNQFSDISSDSNPACAQPPPILPINYAQMHVLSGAKDQAVLPNDDGDGGALRSNLHRENPVLQMASLSSPNPIAPLTARTFVNQPSQLGAHLHGMESAATITQKQNFISPLHSASSQSSTITTTTCRLKTKAAMKGYDNLKVSIPTIGLDMEHALERSPRAGCKLTTLAEIALGNETPMAGLTSFTPAMQMHNDHKSKCKIKPNDLAEQFPIMLSQPKENQMPPQSKRREKSPVKGSSPIISVHDTESCMPIVLSPPKKPESIIAKDIYEFDDSENTPISKAIQSPFKTAEDNDGSPKKAIIIPERPFKNIGMEEKEAIKFQKPETPAINDDNTTSTVTYSDRDDFVYGSISGGEDDNDNDNDDNKDGNLNSGESSNSSAFTAKTFENKSLIMGRIFKNAKTKPKIPVEKPKLPTPEPPKQIPKQELDRLFDTLRGLNENRQANAAKEERLLENAPNSSRNREVQPSKRKTAAPKPPKPKTNTNKTNKKAATKEEPSSKEIAQLHTELGMSPAEIAELIGEGQRKSQRRCAVNRPKKLVEIWSSDEFEEFLSTKDIIALIEEKEQKTKKRRKTSSTARKSHPPPTPAASNNNTKTATDENVTNHQSEDEKATTSPRKTPKITPKAATENAKKVKPVKGKKKGPTATANVMATKVKPTPKAQKEVKSSRRNSADASKSKTSSPFKKPKNLSKTTAADDSESDFEAELHRKSKGAPIRNRRKTISGKLENDAGSSSCAKKDSGKSKIVSESPAPRKSSTSKQPPADSQVRPQARRKRIASEMLYYWSSSSDEEFGRIESPHDDEDHMDESENYQQHGWIVGDSHKKLVTLLAIAKGNKKVDDCGVKETNSKKKS